MEFGDPIHYAYLKLKLFFFFHFFSFINILVPIQGFMFRMNY